MRINEITDQNLLWVKLNGIIVDLQTEHKRICVILDAMIRTGSVSRNRRIMPVVDEFETQLSKIITMEFPESGDQDILTLQQTAKQLLLEVNDLRKQVKI